MVWDVGVAYKMAFVILGQKLLELMQVAKTILVLLLLELLPWTV